MEMKVASQLIRSLREQRAWSQEHLAQVSGLGLRTIQRIETSGVASYESTKAIASVLEVTVAQLSVESSSSIAHTARRFGSPLVKRASAVVAAMVATVGILFGTGALAKNVMLNVGLDRNGEHLSSPIVTTEVGKTAEIRVDGVMRLVITPTIQPNGNVHLAAKIYESKDNEFVLISAPQVATGDEEPAEIRVTSDAGNSFRVRITPAIQ